MFTCNNFSLPIIGTTEVTFTLAYAIIETGGMRFSERNVFTGPVFFENTIEPYTGPFGPPYFSVSIYSTPSGSGAGSPYAFICQLNNGYTGTYSSYVIGAFNANNNTSAENVAVFAQSSGTGTTNIGMYGTGLSATNNIGVIGSVNTYSLAPAFSCGVYAYNGATAGLTTGYSLVCGNSSGKIVTANGYGLGLGEDCDSSNVLKTAGQITVGNIVASGLNISSGTVSLPPASIPIAALPVIGANTFLGNNLPASATPVAMSVSMAQTLLGCLPLSGGTLTGPLTLAGTTTLPSAGVLNAATSITLEVGGTNVFELTSAGLQLASSGYMIIGSSINFAGSTTVIASNTQIVRLSSGNFQYNVTSGCAHSFSENGTVSATINAYGLGLGSASCASTDTLTSSGQITVGNIVATGASLSGNLGFSAAGKGLSGGTAITLAAVNTAYSIGSATVAGNTSGHTGLY